MFIEVRRLKSESKKQYGQPENVSTRRIMTLKKWENKRGEVGFPKTRRSSKRFFFSFIT